MSSKSANVSQAKDYKLVIEKDVQIPMRDGAILYADVYRPDGGAERFPAIANMSPSYRAAPHHARCGLPDGYA